MKNHTIWRKNFNLYDLHKAYEYEKELQKQGLIKDIKTYNKMLDEYASFRGFWNWNEMIEELQK